MTGHRGVRIGDIVEIRTPRGLAYAQYTHEDAQFGSLIRVLPGLYESRPSDLARVAREQHLWVTFFPVSVGVRRGLIALAGHAEVPSDAARFPVFKVPGLHDPRTGRPLDWGLWDGKRESGPLELSNDQWRLPTLQIVNLKALIHRIVTNWRPEQDATRGLSTDLHAEDDQPEKRTGSSAKARTETPTGTPARHFVVLPNGELGHEVAVAAGREGFDVQLREPSEPGDVWVVVASAPQLDIPAARERLEALAEKYGGEYDGWEAQPNAQRSFEPHRRSVN